MDDLLASTSASYCAVTNPSFMDNLLRQVEAIRTQGAFFLPVDGDLKQPAAATRDIAAAAAELLLGLDILVNNAATVETATWDALDFELWQHVMSVNLNGTMLCAKPFFP
jgi:NAD(P)-dependent dehydrogenase (short-subunit alcohol dehydrogenase family)